jgi:hypothetical protein
MAKLDSAFHCPLAIALAPYAEVRDRITEMLTRYFSRLPAFEVVSSLHLAFRELDDEILRNVVSTPAVGTYMRNAAYDDRQKLITGSRALAIRGLRLIDPEAAFTAARMAFDNQSDRDRHLYPSILMEIDVSKGRSVLLAGAGLEDSSRVFRAIGSSLAGHCDSTLIAEMLDVSDSRTRCAACKLIPYLLDSPDDTLIRKNRTLSADPNQEVAHASIAAAAQLRRVAHINELAEAIQREPDESQQWVLLEALLAICDPGEGSYRTMPEWRRRIANRIPYHLRVRMAEWAEQRRKEINDECRRMDRNK